MGHRIEVMSDGSVDLSVKDGLATKKIPIRVYNIDDDSLGPYELEQIQEILTDSISEISTIDKPVVTEPPKDSVIIEQSFRPGVNDPDGEQVRNILSRVLGREIGNVSRSSQHLWIGDLIPKNIFH
ncbi:MAG: hypothetical protein Q8N99_07370 [Nanoarchaeota archaeon]|nr:hypothetical protein [Nanoarchaeota archaeon]